MICYGFYVVHCLLTVDKRSDDCGKPPEIENADMKQSSGEATYECKEGFHPAEQDANNVIHCNKGGWFILGGSFIKCEPDTGNEYATILLACWTIKVQCRGNPA